MSNWQKLKKKLMVQTIGKEMGLEILLYAAGGIVNWYNYFLKNKTAKSNLWTRIV